MRDFHANKSIKGIGLSDPSVYADTLSRKLDYTNTFYDAHPRFDITDLEWGQPASLDFIIASEVFEHVPPPVQRAFDNLARLLKPGGVAIFTVPWIPDGPTREHFPDLLHWKLVQLGNDYLLVNKTSSGDVQTFENLVFHQGPGQTLEMRVFSRSGLENNFAAAGLKLEFDRGPFDPYGIVFVHPWSLGCIARQPGTLEISKNHVGAQDETTPANDMELQSIALEKLQAQLDQAQDAVQQLQKERDLIKASKWLKLGRSMGFGPRL